MAMVKMDKDMKMIMQVHDELVFEVAKDRVEEAKSQIIETMTTVAELRVPLVVEVGVGDNWDEAH
jgi:DNA polymerase-1